MSKKLLKRNCVVLINDVGDGLSSVIGVFKNKKEANNYLNWLDPKNKAFYRIHHSKRFVYVDTFSTSKTKEFCKSFKEEGTTIEIDIPDRISKELEAIKHIKEIPTARSLTFEDGSNLIEIIEKALTTPTADEVCEAIIKYLQPTYTRKVIVEFKQNELYLFDSKIVQFIGGGLWFNLPVEFPPRLIETIVKFYKEKVKNDWRR